MRQLIVILLLMRLTNEITMAQQPATNEANALWQRSNLTGDWGGLRSNLLDHGFDFQVSYAGEFVANLSGGVARGGLYQHLVNSVVELNMEKLAGWNGATVHANTFWIWGSRPGDISALTGSDFSDPSNLSASDTYRLDDLWLEQALLDDRISIRAGQIAIDDEFCSSDYAWLFLNGAHGWSPFFSASLPNGGPGYPLAATGARLRLQVGDSLNFLAAVTDGDVRNQATDNRHGTQFGFGSHDGLIYFFEGDWQVNQASNATGLPGTYKIGGWYHSGRFNDLRFDDHGVSLQDDGSLSGTPSDGVAASHSGDGGVYLNIDQMLWRGANGSDRNIGAYARVAPWLPNDRNTLNFYAGGGVVVKGLIPGREADLLGLGCSYTRVSGSFSGAQSDANEVAALGGVPNSLSPGPLPDYEMGFEATYQINLAPWWSVQPDFQYLAHPGGSSAMADAVVVGIRTNLRF